MPVHEDVYTTDLLRYPGPWAFGLPRAGIILVSDDEPQIPDLYKLILEKEGYTILSAPGGAQTLELARQEQPDLITTDIMNIHMPGIDLVFQLRNEAATRDVLSHRIADSAFHLKKNPKENLMQTPLHHVPFDLVCTMAMQIPHEAWDVADPSENHREAAKVQ